MTLKIFIIFLFSLNLYALEEKQNTEIENEQAQINDMVSQVKVLVAKMKTIQKACEVLKKFNGKKECFEYSIQIQKKISDVENSVKNQTHSFFAYIKGAIQYSRKCGACDEEVQKKYCPLLDDILTKYDYLN
jgi:uncharacterized phage infection (PIP) family protein YhgE